MTFTVLFEINIIFIGYEKIKAENSKVVFRTVIAMQLQGNMTKDDIQQVNCTTELLPGNAVSKLTVSIIPCFNLRAFSSVECFNNEAIQQFHQTPLLPDSLDRGNRGPTRRFSNKGVNC